MGGMRYWLKGLNMPTHVSDEARADFFWAFGMCPDMQLSLENDFDSMVSNDGTFLLPASNYSWGPPPDG
jgi:hypothetical protein